MKSIIFLLILNFLLSASSLISSNITSSLPSLDEKLQKRQNSIETKVDFDKFIKDMENNIISSGYKTAYYIGLAYSKDFHLKDSSVIVHDYNKALQFFNLAIDNGVNYAAVDAAIIYISQKREYPALAVLEKALDSNYASTESISSYIANMYGSYVLDKFSTNTMIVKKALYYIKKYSLDKKVATTQFIYANLLNTIREFDLANYYLSMACENKSITRELYNICFNSQTIEVNNVKNNNSDCSGN